MWCSQRVGVGLTPTHREDVHRFNVHDELWSWALQACGESRQQVKTGVNKKDTEEGGEIRAALGWGGRGGQGDTVLKVKPKANGILQQIQMPERYSSRSSQDSQEGGLGKEILSPENERKRKDNWGQLHPRPH